MFYLALFVNACSSNMSESENNLQDSIKVNRVKRHYVERKIPDDSLKFHFYSVKKKAEKKLYEQWQLLTDFPKLWIKLDNTANGIVIYHRNGRIARTLELINDSLRNKSLVGENVSWPIHKYEKLDSHNYVFHLGINNLHETFARDTFEILNFNNLLTIRYWQVFRFDDKGNEYLLGYGKSLLIPFENQHLFKHIDEPSFRPWEIGINFLRIDYKKMKDIYGQ